MSSFIVLANDSRLRAIQLWLIFVHVMSVIVGLVLVFGSTTPLMEFYSGKLAEAFWEAKSLPPDMVAYHRWSMGLVGAGTVGWAISHLFILATAFGRGERWSQRAMLVSVLIWITLEIWLSIPVGAWVEVAFVSLAGLAILVPLILAGDRLRSPAH